MKTVLLTLLFSLSAHAESVTYQVNGKTVNISEALKSALGGQAVTQCQNVVLSPNKKGTNFSFKHPKTPKMATED